MAPKLIGAGRIGVERLVFAPPQEPMACYLARHRLADLFLDTLPYNPVGTAYHALLAGLPVLTCAGGTFAGRTAGSMLRAIGLTELITVSLQEYAKEAAISSLEEEATLMLDEKVAEPGASAGAQNWAHSDGRPLN